MVAMDLGFKTAPQHTTWADVLDVWRAADDIEALESGWLFDHFQPIDGRPEGPCLESWVTLTALAQATSRLRLGSMVNGVHHRHPAITANMASALDIVSNGRLVLGLGAGWNEEETSAYGLRLGPLSERFDRFDEALVVIRRLLADEWTHFDGEHFTLTRARNEPKGPQQPLPICIGGNGPKRTLRAVAHHAQQWDFGGWDRPTWEQRCEVLAGHCASIGRDPAEIRRSVHVYVDEGTDLAATRDQVADLADAGVDLAILALTPPHRPAVLERAVEAVLPVT